MESDSLPQEYVDQLKRQGFALLKVLGRGLSGSVYLAVQPSLNRKVAIKFFDSAFVREDQAMQKRFAREANLLAQFQHAGFPYVLTLGNVKTFFGQAPYFVMEYVDGDSLKDILNKEGRLTLDVSIYYAIQIVRALGYAHNQKILHRDVKPANIVVDKNGRCFAIDFSIGVSIEGKEGLTRATNVGEMLGTPPYVAPEQLIDASSVDCRADIYSIGIVLLEMLSGSADRADIKRSLSHIPRNVVNAIEKACAASPADRYQTAEELIDALEDAIKVRGPSSAPAKAICTNTKCPDADWTERGFYRGPKIAEESVDLFCTSCGEQLKYQCLSCGQSVTSARYCGSCGTETYRVPVCAKCGSWLTRNDMDSMGVNGCAKCSSKSPTKAAAKFDAMDDDIPF